MPKAKPKAPATPDPRARAARVSPPSVPGGLTALVARVVSEMSREHPGLVNTSTRAGASVRLPGVISTRCPVLDAAIGVGGIPMGRITILTGPESVGKTTLALHLVAEVQARGGIAIFEDTEHKLDVDYAATLGVDNDNLILIQPNHIEDALGIAAEAVVRIRDAAPGVPIIIVVDSINATRAKEEFEGAFDDKHVGAQARAFSSRLPKLNHHIAGQPVALVFTSQVREHIGFTGTKRELVSGGHAPKFYAAVIIELIRMGFFKEHDRPVGSMIKAKVVKNQVSIPFREADFQIRWGTGIDYHRSLLDRGKALGLLNESAGGWFEVPEGEGWPALKWQGARKFAVIADKHPAFLAYLEAKHRESLL